MVSKLMSLLGSFVVGSAGWWIGSQIGIMSAVIVSGIGTGVGLYYGRRLAAHYDLE